MQPRRLLEYFVSYIVLHRLSKFFPWLLKRLFKPALSQNRQFALLNSPKYTQDVVEYSQPHYITNIFKKVLDDAYTIHSYYSKVDSIMYLTVVRDKRLNLADLVGEREVLKQSQGHVGILHGGFIASLFDEAFGILVHRLNGDKQDFKSMTASLKVDYRNAIDCVHDKDLVVICKLNRVDKRKIYVMAEMRDLGVFDDSNGTEELSSSLFTKNMLYATSEALFIITKDSYIQMQSPK